MHCTWLSVYLVAITSILDWVAYKQQILSLTILEAGKSKVKALVNSVTGESSFLVYKRCLSIVSSKGRRQITRGLFNKGINPTHEGSALIT